MDGCICDVPRKKKRQPPRLTEIGRCRMVVPGSARSWIAGMRVWWALRQVRPWRAPFTHGHGRALWGTRSTSLGTYCTYQPGSFRVDLE